jgi:hypothetical protein
LIVDPDLPRHRKTLKLASRLQISIGDVCLLLINMWGHCQLRKDDFLGADPDDVAACCQLLSVPAKKLHGALLAVGWIDQVEGGFIAHDWRKLNAEWLRKIEGGKMRSRAARDKSGRLMGAASGDTQLAGKSPPASSQLAGATSTASWKNPTSIAGAEERRGEEKSTSTLPARVSAHEDRQDSRSEETFETLSFAKKRMCGVLGLDPARPWSHAAELALPRIMPIPEDEWLAVEWLYRQNDDPKRPKLRMSPGSLCEHWQDEVSKAHQYAQQLDVTLPMVGSAALTEKNNAVPAAWFDFLRAMGYPNASYHEAERSLRVEFRAWCEKERGAAA